MIFSDFIDKSLENEYSIKKLIKSAKSPVFIQKVKQAKCEIGDNELRTIASEILFNFKKIGSGLEKIKEVNALVSAMPQIDKINQNSISLSSIINLIEIYDICKNHRIII